jgi:hypothetical protein
MCFLLARGKHLSLYSSNEGVYKIVEVVTIVVFYALWRKVRVAGSVSDNSRQQNAGPHSQSGVVFAV